MSLVAYGSSGEESDEENNCEETAQATPLTDKPKSLSLPAPKVTSAEPVAETSSNASMFACLPPPKHEEPAVLTEDTDLDEIPVVVKAPSTATARQKVKISIPSLADFKDDDDSAPQPKKPKPTPKGSGLLAILPEPKNVSSRPSRPLVPHVLTKRPVPPKPIKKPAVKPVLVKAHNDSGDESDDEDSAIDFFSLTGQEAPEPAEIKLEDLLPPQAGPSSRPPPAAVRQEVAAPQPVEEVEEEVQQEDLKLDDEALRQLCGRRVQREELNLIDLHGDKMMPDPKEWMLKQMTQEQEMHGHRSSQPSSTHRRKHQITYLAFQAKEREIELKNQWAQNRMTKKQTQAKYGF